MSSSVETPTLGNALALLQLSAENNLASWKIKALGLQQVLVGLAEINAQRLGQLAVLAHTLETKLVEEEKNSAETDPRFLLLKYRLVKESLDHTSKSVQETLKSIDWTDFEANLLYLATHGSLEGKTKKEVQEAAKDALSRLSQLF